jgi:hypothetical protein
MAGSLLGFVRRAVRVVTQRGAGGPGGVTHSFALCFRSFRMSAHPPAQEKPKLPTPASFSTGFRGVSRRGVEFHARVTTSGSGGTLHLGPFKSAEEGRRTIEACFLSSIINPLLSAPHSYLRQAARAYDETARRVFGEKARLNFPVAGERTKSGRSSYVGLSWQPRAHKWEVRLKHAGIMQYLGIFTDELEAAQFWDFAAVWLRGPQTARLNFENRRDETIESVRRARITPGFSLVAAAQAAGAAGGGSMRDATTVTPQIGAQPETFAPLSAPLQSLQISAVVSAQPHTFAASAPPPSEPLRQSAGVMVSGLIESAFVQPLPITDHNFLLPGRIFAAAVENPRRVQPACSDSMAELKKAAQQALAQAVPALDASMRSSTSSTFQSAAQDASMELHALDASMRSQRCVLDETMRSLRENENIDDDMSGFASSTIPCGAGMFYRVNPQPCTSNVEFFMAAASVSLAQMSEGGGHVHAAVPEQRFPLSSPPATMMPSHKFTIDEHARVDDVCKDFDRVEHSGGAHHYLRTTPKVFAAAAADSSGSAGGTAGGSPHGLLGAAALINLSESSENSI